MKDVMVPIGSMIDLIAVGLHRRERLIAIKYSSSCGRRIDS